MATHPAPTIGNHLCLSTTRMNHSAFSHTCEVTLAHSIDGGQTPQAVADAIQAEIQTNFQSFISDNVLVEPTFVQVGDGSNVPAVAVASGATYNGTNTMTEPSPQVSVLLKKTTPLGGKKHRGRTYFPFVISESDIDEAGRVDSGLSAPLTVAAEAYLTAMAGFLIPMVIANKTLVTSPGETRPHVTAITTGPQVTGWGCEAFVATQRRRLVRG